MPRSIFVTGTDTGVGKTHVAANLVLALRRRGVDAGAMKPVATGALRGVSEDAVVLWAAVQQSDALDLINPVCLKPPLAPSVASRVSNKPIDLRRIWSAYRRLSSRHECMVVEGVGGLLVPILDRYPVARMVKRLGLPLVVVTRPTLGTINHTALTVRVARSLGLRVLGLIINHHEKFRIGPAERTCRQALETECRVPVLGEVPHRAPDRVFDRIADRLWATPERPRPPAAPGHPPPRA
jgi:dethiobiotin synthetase